MQDGLFAKVESNLAELDFFGACFTGVKNDSACFCWFDNAIALSSSTILLEVRSALHIIGVDNSDDDDETGSCIVAESDGGRFIQCKLISSET